MGGSHTHVSSHTFTHSTHIAYCGGGDACLYSETRRCFWSARPSETWKGCNTSFTRQEHLITFRPYNCTFYQAQQDHRLNDQQLTVKMLTQKFSEHKYHSMGAAAGRNSIDFSMKQMEGQNKSRRKLQPETFTVQSWQNLLNSEADILKLI